MSFVSTGRTFLAVLDKEDATLAAAHLKTAHDANTPGIAYAFSVALSPELWSSAHAVGTSRTLLKKLRGRKAHEARGADDERIDTEGALGEIVLALLLEKAGALIAPLVAHKPEAGGLDLHLDGAALDVKTVGESRTMLNINQRAHLDKRADGYLVAKVARADVLDVFYVSARVVDGWTVNKFARGEAIDPRRYYYSARLPRLAPLPEECEA